MGRPPETDQLTAVATLSAAVWGDSGPRVLLVHGDVTGGEQSWSRQRPLAERWRLVVPDRRGFGESPPTAREDFAVDALDLDELMGDGAHLVGHSYGAIGAMMAAAGRPPAALSLCVIEPPCFGVARGHPAVEETVAAQRALLAEGPRLDDTEFLRRFLACVGGDPDRLPSPLTPALSEGARVVRGFRPPWDAVIPLARLRAARVPVLCVSGGHSRAFDAVLAVIARRLGADTAVVPGAGHNVPRMADELNGVLEAFWTAARHADGPSALA